MHEVWLLFGFFQTLQLFNTFALLHCLPVKLAWSPQGLANSASCLSCSNLS